MGKFRNLKALTIKWNNIENFSAYDVNRECRWRVFGEEEKEEKKNVRWENLLSFWRWCYWKLVIFIIVQCTSSFHMKFSCYDTSVRCKLVLIMIHVSRSTQRMKWRFFISTSFHCLHAGKNQFDKKNFGWINKEHFVKKMKDFRARQEAFQRSCFECTAWMDVWKVKLWENM